MSGFIRVKELPTRFEVRYLGCYSTFFDAKDTAEERKHLKNVYPSKPVDRVTIRRWQVKRTEVKEKHYEHFTVWSTPTIVLEAIWRRTGWCLRVGSCVSSRDSTLPNVYPTREESEAAARVWLKDNGFRLKKAGA